MAAFVRCDVRDHIVTPKIDHGFFVGGATERFSGKGSLRISFRGRIFDAAQFSTFSTVSANKRHRSRMAAQSAGIVN